jgi:hypothetical protein
MILLSPGNAIWNFMDRQIVFSMKAFGEGRRTRGIIAHIRKEIKEVLKAPNSPYEWIDIAILALDGAWRSVYGGTSPDMARQVSELVAVALLEKQRKNVLRKWPKPISQNTAVEHIK